MPDIGDALNGASLFAGVIGLLFSSWIADITSAADKPLAPHRADRRPDSRRLGDAFATKAIPLILLMTVFLYANLSTLLFIFRRSLMYIPFVEGRNDVDVEWSIYVIVNLAILYFLAYTVKETARLISKWRKTAENDNKASPRVSTP